MKQIIHRQLNYALWSAVLFLAGLLAFNALHYYNFNPAYGILSENLRAFKDWIWTVGLYIHVGAGVICLFIPIVLFNSRLFKLSSRAHQFLGKIYVIDTLCVVVPTGLYMAFFAKGGTITQLGFVLQGLLTFGSTYLAYIYVRRKDVDKHIIWMKRSYGFASAVITFRVLHISFYYLEIPYDVNYALSQWMCMLLNALGVEISITHRLRGVKPKV